jgi:hypothetical protein
LLQGARDWGLVAGRWWLVAGGTLESMGTKTLCLLLLSAAWLSCDEKYDGPVPPKPDLPYLLQAKKLSEVEIGKARQERRKDDTVSIIAGPGSSARTPLPEPIFILDARELEPQKIELFRLEVKDGNREVSLPNKDHTGASQPLHLRITPLGGHLYKIEASEMLEEGEYALAPTGDNRIFCFEIY